MALPARGWLKSIVTSLPLTAATKAGIFCFWPFLSTVIPRTIPAFGVMFSPKTFLFTVCSSFSSLCPNASFGCSITVFSSPYFMSISAFSKPGGIMPFSTSNSKGPVSAELSTISSLSSIPSYSIVTWSPCFTSHASMPRCLRRGWMASSDVNVFKKVVSFHVAVMPHPLGWG